MYIFQRQQVGVVEDGDELVLQVGVNHPALVVFTLILLVFLEEALLLPGWRPCRDSFRSSRFG